MTMPAIIEFAQIAGPPASLSFRHQNRRFGGGFGVKGYDSRFEIDFDCAFKGQLQRRSPPAGR